MTETITPAPGDDRWHQMADQVAQFRSDTGRFPTRTTADGDAAWKERAEQVAEFRRTHGVWPRVRNATPEEARLGRWLSKLRTANTGDQLTDDHRDYLEGAAPGWRGDDDARWRTAADKVAAFHQQNQRWPNSKAASDDERKLGTWLTEFRRHVNAGTGTNTAERQAYLDEVAPAWREDDTAWQATADAVATFRRENQRWPRRTAPTTDETRLGVWLSTTRHAAKTNRYGWTPEREQYLDEVAAGWRGINSETTWAATADEVARFHQIHGRWPARTATAPADERKLGAWLATTRKAAKTGTNVAADRARYMDEVAPGWTGEDRQVTWERTADAVGAFHRENGRWPSTVAAADTERRLGQWLAAARKHSKTGTKGWSDERGTHLDETAPGWRGDRTD